MFLLLKNMTIFFNELTLRVLKAVQNILFCFLLLPKVDLLKSEHSHASPLVAEGLNFIARNSNAAQERK